MKLDFQELWSHSIAFRSLFIRNGIFHSVNNVDVAKAEAFWWDRFPKLDWGFCDYNGCGHLVVDGERCQQHLDQKKMPKWKWANGILYRYLHFYPGNVVKVLRPEYRAYHIHLAEKIYGKTPNGCAVYYADGNPFNLRRNNLILLSKVSLAAVKSGVLSVEDAEKMDFILKDFLKEVMTIGRPKKEWKYGLNAIAENAGVDADRVSLEIHRGNLDPSSLTSVIEFCLKLQSKKDGTLSKFPKQVKM